MIVNVNLSEEEFNILEEHAIKNDIGISEYIRRTMLEKMEDEEDIRAADKAYAKYLKDLVTYTHEEVWKKLAV